MNAFFLSALLLASPTFAQDTAPEDAWKATLERVAPAVVSLKVVGTRSFDTEGAGASVGTGFIVDAEQGLILTNRHMVHAGPVVAEAVLLNNEEIPLTAVYRDPVHDFGFYRFDPADVRFQAFEPLALNPEGAQVGVEIRVVGNDAGDKISFLDGTLSRLDRPAPGYGGNTFNDFNTFYIQAASGTSGGSSGSPVVNVSGEVVALNAGGKRSAASSFYLPLDRVERALELIQAGEPVPRGTLQTVFEHTSYDELRRLGLREETEAMIRERFPEGTGMLVVGETVPGGPAHEQLRPGDVLVRLNGEPITTFLPLEVFLDGHVGGAVELGVERGGEPLRFTLTVGDLHAITPDAYLEVGGAVINALSYQQARNHVLPAQGIYVATPGYVLGEAGVPDGAVITAVDGEAVADLAALEAKFAGYADGARVPIRYFPIQDPRQDQVAVVTIDRTWYVMQRCTRDDASGRWPCAPSPAAPEAEAAEGPIGSTTLDTEGPRVAQRLAASLVKVEFDVPYRTEGVGGSHFAGAGLIVDAERGLVVADRDTVPISLGDLELVFGGSLRVPAEIVYVHPLHNFVVLRYDPALIGDTPVASAPLREAEVEPGDALWLVGLSSSHKVVSRRTEAGRIDPLYLASPSRPVFRDTNLEVIDVTEAVPSIGGVLTDKRGRVVALWASFVSYGGGNRDSFFRGLPVEYILDVIEPIAAGEDPALRWMGAELYPVSLADARDRGLSDARADQLTAHDPQGRQVLYVVRSATGTAAQEQLAGGDLILAIDGQPVTRFGEVERASQAEALALTVLRDGQELELTLPTTALSGHGVEHVVAWSGLLLHEPHLELAYQRGLEPEGVYISWFWYGSPAHRYNLRPTRRIMEVDGQPTPDLESFLEIVSKKEDGESVRVLMLDLDDKPIVQTLKVDNQFWPTEEFKLTDDGWVRVR
ncbi:MAG: trypsin-like peptidase domain-containing protein [Alphaproteobacteria bacterium]|nr:trypsin-like peptidase domain-containing protein [Alphaproteobacteria bacterium]